MAAQAAAFQQEKASTQGRFAAGLPLMAERHREENH
jgi:hypothetical protein